MSTRQPLIAGNWKLHCTLEQSRALAAEIREAAHTAAAAELVVAPVFTALSSVAQVLKDSPVSVSAQDVHHEDQGAFTGEVSAPLLADAGCRYAIVGHSERRQLFGETDDTVQRKVQALLRAGLTPILCLGETLQQREQGSTLDVVLNQLERGLANLETPSLAGLVLAYEPIWAIGTGRTASPADAQEVHAAIRNRLAERRGQPFAGATRILYGGSVKPDNARELLKQPDLDGALVGGASLEAESFMAIARSVS